MVRGATVWRRVMLGVAFAVLGWPVAATCKPAAIDTRVDALLAAAKAGEIRPLETALPTITAPGLRALVRARIDASRLNGPGVEGALKQYWDSKARDPARDAIAWSIAADNAFAEADYGKAAKASQALMRLLAVRDPHHELAGATQDQGVASLLAALPRQAVIARAPVTVPMTHDKAGLLRIDVRVNGKTQSAVLDTGANVSVVSQSTAKRLGIAISGGDGSVGSSSRAAVATRVGSARKLQIAGVTLANVAFLVLPDTSLNMPLPHGAHFQIDAIIGFPVLEALGRMRFSQHAFVPLPAPVESTATGRRDLYAIGNTLFAAVDIDGIHVPLVLDTGAPASSLSDLFARHYPKLLVGLARLKQHSAGAGGAVTQEAAIWKNVRVDIDGHHATLSKLPIALSPSVSTLSGTYGTLGLDALKHFGSFTLDLRNMQLLVGNEREGQRRQGGSTSSASAARASTRSARGTI